MSRLYESENAWRQTWVDDQGDIVEFENGFRLYHMGDTGLFGDMRLIGRYYRPDLVSRVTAQARERGVPRRGVANQNQHPRLRRQHDPDRAQLVAPLIARGARRPRRPREQ